MIINHNMSAINANRQMSANQSATAKSTEKLSSGLRINRAGDDAAGLAISEKMRAQVSGLDQATRNAQDGISLIQTAEGALNESHSILQRMRELSVQSSNDTNTDADRAELQKEVDQLSQEITRIAGDTQFNEKELLDGTFSGTFHIGANSGQNIEVAITNMNAETLGVAGVLGKDVTVLTDLTANNITKDEYTIKFTAAGDKDAAAVTETTATVDKDAKEITITLKQDAGDGANGGDIKATLADLAKVLEGTGVMKATVAEGKNATVATVGGNVTLTKGVINKEAGINISSQESASDAITTIDGAIKNVSAERSKLGAYQNRLEHTINNLGTSSENLTAAESRIRDVDMAEEMMEFTKNNVLSQASQAMLAQAKALPNQVLSLLQ